MLNDIQIIGAAGGVSTHSTTRREDTWKLLKTVRIYHAKCCWSVTATSIMAAISPHTGSDNLSRQMVTNLSTVAVVPTTPQVPLRHFTQHLCSALNSIGLSVGSKIIIVIIVHTAPTLRLTSSLLQEELGQAALERYTLV